MHTLTPPSETVDSLVGQGIAAVKAGDPRRGYDLLAQALEANPRHEQGWLWLSGVVGSDAERYYCLEQVLTINPHSGAARHGLGLLPRGLAPVSPLAGPPEPVPEAVTTTTTHLGLLAPAFFADAPAEPAPAVVIPTPLPNTPAAPAAPQPARPIAPQADIDFVVRELGANRTRDEVARMLCEQRSYEWSAAQQIVGQVSMQQRVTIARRQAPVLISMGVATFLGGLLLIGYAVLLFSSRTAIHTPYYYRNMIFAFGLGVMMALGAAIGLAQVVRSLWK